MNKQTRVSANAIIAAASDPVASRRFFEAVFPPEERVARLRELQEQCIRAINRGDTYGWPPALVAQCKVIVAEREPILGLTAQSLRDPMGRRADG